MAHGLPIVFLHYGASHYLPFTMGRAKMLNLNSPVVLIGDAANEKYLPFVQHVNMNRYARQAAAFEKIYKHLSPNGRPYELFCFLRWFILRDFMRAHAVERFIHVDSDVLLSVNVEVERLGWQDHDLTLVNGVCAGNMFVNGMRGLEELCQIIWDMYAAPDAEQKLMAIYAEAQKCNGGISDMVPLNMLAKTHPGRIAEMTGIQPDGSYWDANIRMDEGFEMRDGMKAVRWINGQPYCRHVESGRDILFKSLHYQGAGKDFIAAAFRLAYPSPIQRAA